MPVSAYPRHCVFNNGRQESLKQRLEMLPSSSWECQNISAGCLPFESYFSFAGITDPETPNLTAEKPQVDATYLGDPLEGASTGVNVLNMFTQPRDIQKLQRRTIPRKMRWTPKNTLVLEMEQAKQFRSQPAQAVGPKGLLYVQQREFAATTSKDGSVSILGSDDATTCHFVVLRHTGSGAICLTHCDGSDTETEVMLMINAVKVLSPSTDCGRLELHLIGGFCDDRRLSQRLTSQLLRAFDRLLDNVYLMTFCVTELNDRQENGRHLPYIYGIAANVKTGEIFHATFPDRGPDEDMRSARVLTGAKMISVYDSKKEQLCIGPYYWMPFPHVDFWLEQSNQSILQNLSTSPLAEPPHFVAHIRATLLYLREHPFPDKTLFPTEKPRLYKKNAEGLWERVSGQI
ncbi:protein N-terminal asparagine amidohydrolase isoform 2-T3 [Vipera latastei]